MDKWPKVKPNLSCPLDQYHVTFFIINAIVNSCTIKKSITI